MPWFEHTEISDSLSFTVTGDVAYIYGKERNFNCSCITVEEDVGGGFEIRFNNGSIATSLVYGSSIIYTKP
jgi:hypothetical protein